LLTTREAARPLRRYVGRAGGFVGRYRAHNQKRFSGARIERVWYGPGAVPRRGRKLDPGEALDSSAAFPEYERRAGTVFRRRHDREIIMTLNSKGEGA
jgi:hypothetical protein